MLFPPQPNLNQTRTCLTFSFLHSLHVGPVVPLAWQAQSLVHAYTVLISYFARFSFLIPHAVAQAHPMPSKPIQWCMRTLPSFLILLVSHSARSGPGVPHARQAQSVVCVWPGGKAPQPRQHHRAAAGRGVVPAA